MQIVIIGTGNAAFVLGRKLKKAGHSIIQVFGRDSMEASKLAYELDTRSTNYWNVINKGADLYIIAVSDIAIEDVLSEVNLPDKTIVHTAASVPMEVLKGHSAHYGILYPLQSLKKEMKVVPDIPFIISASDDQTLQMLETLAHTMSDNVITADDELRANIHVAAVFCNNFVNHMYDLADHFCKSEGIDFQFLWPLIMETAERIKTIEPSKAQTGPAVRNDQQTIHKHLALLKKYPHLNKIYSLLTESIIESR
jgi:predicted short-subunit dehydrogenase-like oxidoreductase (DUF2520 family)